MRDDGGHTVDTSSHLACRRIVRALIGKYGWALLREDDLVELVLGSAQPGISAAEVERLAKHHYTIALYEACWQGDDPDRRERGYGELFRFLFRAAHNRCPDLAEDVTQRAIVLVYEQIDRCRSPGTFLAFALNKLRHALQQEQPVWGREVPLDETCRSSGDGSLTASPSELDRQERLQVMLDAIGRLPDERQRQAILLKFFGGLSDEAIGARLDITAGHVRVLRHRGISRLRQDERLREYFEPRGT
jgi:RNA polymerase sigma factor (sigma-70 family)